jgi:PAS domain S-box-containing protein
MNQLPKKKLRLSQLLRLPSKVLNTRIRLAIGLALGVLTLVLLAQLFRIIPNPNKQTMAARKLQTETLALTGSALIESTNSLDTFRTTLQHAADRDDQLISIGLRNSENQLVVQINAHEQQWQFPADGRSNDRFMYVPIYRDNKQIGQLEMCYQPLLSISTWLRSPDAKLVVFMALGSFVIFNLILYRTIRQLDPRGAVPQRVREALDNMAEGLVIVDRSGIIMLANSKFSALLGAEADKLVGVNCGEFAWQTEDELPWVRVVRERASVFEQSLQLESVDGLRTFSVSAAPVLGSKGSCRGVMITFDDITALEEHKLELIAARQAADDANEAKSRFLSRMSHEIRTPMNAIIGYTDILRQGCNNKTDQRQYLETIHASGDHLLTVINDILDLSKIEAGQMKIERRRFELVPLLVQVVKTLKLGAEAKGLKLDLQIERIPDRINSDETRLRQVLINVIGNAVKFTSEGGVTLTARMTQEGLLEMDVADTGVGISSEAVETIFNPFMQADESVNRKFGGTGLGLSISKQLSESMGGGISVSSEEGVGTVFTITIDPGELAEDVRMVTADEIQRISVAKQQQPSQESQKFSGHVLIVDDTKANRDLAGLMLKRLGLTFETADDGQEALDRIAARSYDLVFMDVHMPVLDGMSATRILRETDTTTRIVALTALAGDDEKQRCLDSGCNGFLTKPIRMEALVKTLKKFLPSSDEVPALPDDATLTTHFTTPHDSRQSDEAEANSLKNDELMKVESEDEIESSLFDTLSSLGIECDELDEPAVNFRLVRADLTLPNVVSSSLPPDEEILPIVAEFAERLRERLREFDDANQAGDIAKLNELGHWLAGAAGTVGFDDFVEASRELEYSDGGDVERTADLINFINQLTDRIELTDSLECQ